MSSKGFLRAGFCAFSLSVSLVAGCASPVVPTPATGGEVPAPAAQAPTEGTPAGQPAPTAPAPAAVTPVTLSGNASFRGEALSGYDVTVLDAQTGKAVERKADLAGVTTLAVLDKNLKTDASGAFSFQVVGLKPGQALRVQIRQGNGLLETIVTSDLQALGAKKMQLLQANAGAGLSINELTTAIAKIARGVLTTTQVLSPEAAAPVLAQLATEMATLSVKLDAALKSNPSLANNLVSTQGKESEAVNSLVSNAGALKEVTQAVARLVSQVAKSSAAAPAATADVQAALAKVEFIGTVLTGAFSANGFQLSNSATGQSVNATTGDVGSVSSNVSGSTGSSSSSSSSIIPDVVVTSKADLIAAVGPNSTYAGKIVGLGGDIDMAGASLVVAKGLTLYGNGYSLNGGVQIDVAGATVKSIKLKPVAHGDGTLAGVYVNAANATLDGVTITGTETDSAVTTGTGLKAERGVITTAAISGILLSVSNSGISRCASGIYLQAGAKLTATSNVFTNNFAAIGSDSADLTGTVTGNVFSTNHEDIGLGTPVLTGTYPTALKAKLKANNTGAAHVNFYDSSYITTSAQLQTAINSGSATHLILDETFTASAPIVVNRTVTIEGNGVTSAKGFEFTTGSAGSKLSNLTITGQGYLDSTSTDAAIYISSGKTSDPVTFEKVTINYASAVTTTNVNAVALLSSNVVVKDCNFTVTGTTSGKVTGLYATYGTLKVTGTTFSGNRGMVVYSDSADKTVVDAISGNTFNNSVIGVYLYGNESKQTSAADVMDTRTYVLNGNSFGSSLTSNEATPDTAVKVKAHDDRK